MPNRLRATTVAVTPLSGSLNGERPSLRGTSMDQSKTFPRVVAALMRSVQIWICSWILLHRLDDLAGSARTAQSLTGLPAFFWDSSHLMNTTDHYRS